MSKRIFYHGLVSGLLSAIAAITYNRIYFFMTEADFSKVVNIGSLTGINLLGCLLAALGFGLFRKWFKKNAQVIFNFSFAILSFASIILPISVSLPLSIKQPELFPGLVMPMHFFPALAWFTLDPLFRED